MNDPHPTEEAGLLERSIRYYDRWYAGPPSPPRDFGAYLDLLRPLPPGGAWLDVGCGPGFMLREVRSLAGWRAVGVDLSLRALSSAGNLAGSAHALSADGEALPFPDATFDVVSALGTLEHFPSPERGAREIARVLKPRGRALVVVPNERFLGWQIRGMAGTEQRDNLELLLDRRGWGRLLGAAGLDVTRVGKDPWHTKPAPAPVRWLRRLANALIPVGRNYQFAFVSVRAEVVPHGGPD
ncbi:MAG: class I SAM-dependent methyltransferase [Gemmatimonadota bacterium]